MYKMIAIVSSLFSVACVGAPDELDAAPDGGAVDAEVPEVDALDGPAPVCATACPGGEFYCYAPECRCEATAELCVGPCADVCHGAPVVISEGTAACDFGDRFVACVAE